MIPVWLPHIHTSLQHTPQHHSTNIHAYSGCLYTHRIVHRPSYRQHWIFCLVFTLVNCWLYAKQHRLLHGPVFHLVFFSQLTVDINFRNVIFTYASVTHPIWDRNRFKTVYRKVCVFFLFIWLRSTSFANQFKHWIISFIWRKKAKSSKTNNFCRNIRILKGKKYYFVFFCRFVLIWFVLCFIHIDTIQAKTHNSKHTYTHEPRYRCRRTSEYHQWIAMGF